MGRPPKIHRKISAAGRAAMARAGVANLRKYHEGVLSTLTAQVRERTQQFERSIRTEFPDPPAIVAGLVESAIASFSSLIKLTSLQSAGSIRIDRMERVHALQVEAQRNLFRVSKALAAYSETSDAQERRLSAIRRPQAGATPEVASTPEEAELTEAKRRKDAAWHKFMTDGFSGAPPSDRIEDYKDGD